jgi:CrcB protein
MEQFETYLLVAVGSAIGGCARYAIGGAVARAWGPEFPWGTLVVNTTGCFVIGLFLTAALGRLDLDPRWRLLVAIGFCGGYTTFSTFAWEVAKLMEGRDYLLAAADVVGSTIAGLAALWCGAALARWLW